MLLCEPVPTVSLPPPPQAVLIVLKETWMYNVNTTPGAEGGEGGRENALFWRAVALVAKGFWPGL